MKREAHLLAMGLTLGLVAALQCGCAGGAKITEPSAQPTATPAQTTRAPAMQSAESAPAKAVLSGKVAETMNAGGYTYICLERDGVKTWSAVRQVSVKVGDHLEILPGIAMANFTSKALNRTFDRIMFSDGLAPKK